MKVSSWTEWDPLKSVILGSAKEARVSMPDPGLKAISYAGLSNMSEIPSGPYPQQVLEEAEEDLESLNKIFRDLNIQVYRPEPYATEAVHSVPGWQSDSQYFFCPRDSVLVHGDLIIETPMPLRGRYFESLAYRDIFSKAFDHGARWISAPKPLLKEENYIQKAQAGVPSLRDLEICFDAANVLRCGRDLFYLVSNSGNKKGAQWLQSTLGAEFRVHPLEGIYSYMHIDSTISLLRPGLVLLNPSRIKKDQIPAPLNKWNVVWCPEPTDIGFYPPYENASTWIGMNLLMIHPHLALVEASQQSLIKELEKNKIDVIPISMRHQRTLGGGAHCVTLDLHREGTLESYF